MSSMLKKSGGLSFKPKAGRRPGAGPGRPPTASASSSTTRAPTAEAPSQASQASTPVPLVPSASTEVPATTAVEAAKHGSKEIQPVSAEQPPTPPPTQSQPSSQPPVPSSQPTTRAIQPIQKPAEPRTFTSEATNDSEPQRDGGTAGKAAGTNTIRSAATPEISTAQPTPSIENDTVIDTRPTGAPSAAVTRSTASAAASSALTPEPSAPAPRGSALAPAAALPTPSPAPFSDTISVIPPADEPTASTSVSAPKKRAPRKRRSTAVEGEASAEGSAPKRKRQRKKATTTTEGDAEATEGEGAGAGEGGTLRAKKGANRRRREATPEDAETRTVDHSTMKVGELTKDLGIGKKFKHHEAIEDRAREKRLKYRMKKLERDKQRLLGLPAANEDDAASRAGTPAEGNRNERASAMAELGASQQGVGYEVIDGQIIINQQSLVVNRHNQDMSALETVEEDDFTNLTTSRSFAKRAQGANHWTDEETERFYRYLQIFGTDFETISHMFPLKNRRAVKLKFNREERTRPNRINQAVMVLGEKRHAIDLDEYKSSRKEWRESDDITAEQARLAAEHDREIAQLRRERREAGLLDDDDDEEAGNAEGGGSGSDKSNAAAPNGDAEAVEEDAAEDGDGDGGSNGADGSDTAVDATTATEGAEAEAEAGQMEAEAAAT
ncbi:hypothetical protein GGR56DRAFT_264261 [Xylariaceae sp. FL0804]|nr:hypothetical protein GGR56DRAFT_264261 [Xylariaceae sp. FL0804]